MKKTGYAIVGFPDPAPDTKPPAAPPTVETPPLSQPEPVCPAASSAAPPPSDQPSSVVSKVAKILTHHSQESKWDHSIHLDAGCVQQKVLASLQSALRPLI